MIRGTCYTIARHHVWRVHATPFKGKLMSYRFIVQRASHWLAVAALLGCGLVMAQTEPTLNQVYEAAQAGRLEQAQGMMQQVLVAHPNSGKAHFVQAELAARQGQIGRAREALTTAEKLTPGLPFAKPEAVQALRAQLAVKSTPTAGSANRAVGTPAAAYPTAPASSFPWGLALALGGGVIALGIYFSRRQTPGAPVQQAAYGNPGAANGLSGPQSFGMPGGGLAPAYGQPAGSGLGGRVMGGLATGLAVGAGMMAAQAIGKSLMGNDSPHQADATPANNYEPLAGNSDLGGQNFGVNDSSSWDDGGSALASSDDGGGWDS
jgi:hypothetical protein